MYRYMKKLITFSALVVTTWICVRGGYAQETMIISYDRLTDTRYDTLVIAKVGDIEITAKEFLLSYEYGPAFVKRQPESRERFLEFMIYEKLLALEGYHRGLDTTKIVTQTLSDIEGDLATEELYKQDILSQIEVTEEEIAQAVKQEKVHLSLKWLYAPTFEQIKHLQQQLQTGAPFDSLFEQQLSDSVARADRMMETTRFKLGTRNPTLAAIVDTLAYGTNSASIGTTDGWYIVRISDAWRHAITTEAEQARLAYNVRRALVKRRADALSDQYVHNLMLQHDPVIKRQTFDLLRAHIGKTLFPPEHVAEWELTKKLMAEFGPIDSVKIDDHLYKTLVTLTTGDFKVHDFLSWYQTRKSTIHFSTASPQSFFVFLEQLIWRMVRDELLEQEARSRNLHKTQIVKIQKQWWQDKSVSALAKAKQASEIELDEAAIKHYYEQNKKDYRNHAGEPLPLAEVEKQVERDAYTFERQKKMLHRILALKQKYAIVINEEVLHALPIDIEHQPDAIDVYAAKQGGTYPRPAYPTIDYEWQRWF